jgi:sulfonate transport system ATP-binding protein
MAWFEAKDLRKNYGIGGALIAALDGFSLSAERGDFVSIVGRSGSGKTTFLRIVAGLTETTSGELSFGSGTGAAKIGMVFQEPRLMPWLTVEQNILFPFLRGPRASMPIERSARFLGSLGLLPYRNAYPAQLSGGMAQRAALGRALCYEPEIILMDEPLGSLDYFTRRSLQDEILRLHMAENLTIFFVTHDVEEAIKLSRRVVVIDEGRKIGDIPIDLDFPRKQSDPGFARKLDEILSLIVR